MKLKHLIICLLALCCQNASAKDDPEDKLVRVYFFNGDSIDGYIRSDLKTGLKNMFSKSGSIHQYINIGVEPKGGETHRYSASQVKRYRFLEPSEGYPEGFTVVSERINAPSMFKPHNSTRGFASQLNRMENGSVLKWNVWESTGGRNSINRLVPAIGVKLRGMKAAYGIMINGRVSLALLLHYLKKQDPELRKYLEQYYHKGADKKAHMKELVDNPSSLIALYDEYLKTHEPVNDPEADKEPEAADSHSEDSETAGAEALE